MDFVKKRGVPKVVEHGTGLGRSGITSDAQQDTAESRHVRFAPAPETDNGSHGNLGDSTSGMFRLSLVLYLSLHKGCLVWTHACLY